MVDIITKIEELKAHEEFVLRAYHPFFRRMYGSIPRLRPTFTTDVEKWSKMDLMDRSLKRSCDAFMSLQDENITFAIHMEEDGPISAFARITFQPEGIIHIPEIVFSKYKDYGEKREIVEEIISYLKEYGRDLGFSTISWEVPNVVDEMNMALGIGLSPMKEPNRITSQYRTVVFEISIDSTRSNSDGCTRSRKQTN